MTQPNLNIVEEGSGNTASCYGTCLLCPWDGDKHKSINQNGENTGWAQAQSDYNLHARTFHGIQPEVA
jgi:hypothetical protein